MIAFGISEIILSQIPNFDKLWWLSTVAAVMSFTYSGIGLGLGIAKVAGTIFNFDAMMLLILKLVAFRIKLFFYS